MRKTTKLRLNPPFSSLKDNRNLTLKEQWLAPWLDPAFLTILGLTMLATIYCLITITNNSDF